MGGVAHGGRRVTQEEGRAVADKVLGKLKPLLAKSLVCGSLRRLKETAGDVDLVVLPKKGREAALNAVLGKMFGWKITKPDEAKHSGLVDGVQVDCSVAREADEWGARTMFLTGSWQWNVKQRVLAKGKGWLLNEKGLWDADGKRLAGPTEEGLYKALGMTWVPPEGREV